MRFARRSERNHQLSRRNFMQASAGAAGGLLVSLYAKLPAWGHAQSAPSPSPNAYVEIHPDGKNRDHGQTP
jgi:isoquinoline 1-oxidoreductase subunit beta